MSKGRNDFRNVNNLEKRRNTITALMPGSFRAHAEKDLAMVVLQQPGQPHLPPLANPEELLASLPAGEDGVAESAHLLGKSSPCLT